MRKNAKKTSHTYQKEYQQKQQVKHTRKNTNKKNESNIWERIPTKKNKSNIRERMLKKTSHTYQKEYQQKTLYTQHKILPVSVADCFLFLLSFKFDLWLGCRNESILKDFSALLKLKKYPLFLCEIQIQ